jgi:hypothetical protein
VDKPRAVSVYELSIQELAALKADASASPEVKAMAKDLLFVRMYGGGMTTLKRVAAEYLSPTGRAPSQPEYQWGREPQPVTGPGGVPEPDWAGLELMVARRLGIIEADRVPEGEWTREGVAHDGH